MAGVGDAPDRAHALEHRRGRDSQVRAVAGEAGQRRAQGEELAMPVHDHRDGAAGVLGADGLAHL